MAPCPPRAQSPVPCPAPAPCPASAAWLAAPASAARRTFRTGRPSRTPPTGRGPWLILHGMNADDGLTAGHGAEPDVARLFAPVAVEETFAGVLTEAGQVLGQLEDPVDAELWGSDLIGALASSAAGPSSLTNTLTGSLIPAAEAASTPAA